MGCREEKALVVEALDVKPPLDWAARSESAQLKSFSVHRGDPPRSRLDGNKVPTGEAAGSLEHKS